MEATPEMIAMAKRIAWETVLRVEGTTRENMQVAALAAIIETTELAAKLAESLPHVTRSPKSGVSVWGPDSVARALRNNDHLKGPDNAQ
jgi:hypothetical protein